MIHDNLFEYKNSLHRSNETYRLEQQVIQEINRVFGDEYELYNNVIVKEASRFRQEVDILAKRKGVPRFVVEVKLSIHSKHGVDTLLRNMASCQVSYGILTDGKEYFLYVGFSSGLHKKMALEEIKNIIDNNTSYASQEDNVSIPELRKKIMEAIPSIENIEYDAAKDNLNRVKGHLQHLNDTDFILSSGYIEFSSDSIEDKFFMVLLGEYNDDQVCRYTTSTSLYLTLKDSKHNMCNIVCMNDKGESSYADHYTHTETPLREERIKEINRAFILSLSEIINEDDLTMWRLYADDAKGVCLRYERNNNVRNMENFFFAKVSYADPKTKKHYELDYIKTMMHDFPRKFKFKRWNIWKHFFKSSNYITEHEVRLLYVAPEQENDKNIETIWMQDYKSGIMCEMKLFNYAYSPTSNLFPLRISHIYLGPKYPEAEVCAQQIGYLLTKSKVYKTSSPYDMVHKSGIDDYR